MANHAPLSYEKYRVKFFSQFYSPYFCVCYVKNWKGKGVMNKWNLRQNETTKMQISECNKIGKQKNYIIWYLRNLRIIRNIEARKNQWRVDFSTTVWLSFYLDKAKHNNGIPLNRRGFYFSFTCRSYFCDFSAPFVRLSFPRLSNVFLHIRKMRLMEHRK